MKSLLKSDPEQKPSGCLEFEAVLASLLLNVEAFPMKDKKKSELEKLHSGNINHHKILETDNIVFMLQ